MRSVQVGRLGLSTSDIGETGNKALINVDVASTEEAPVISDDDVLALFDRWRVEIDSEPAPSLILLEVACVLFVAGRAVT